MTALLTSDVHMTASARDSYRWGLFDWLLEQAVKLKVHVLIINGDLTDAKDRHPASLADRLVRALAALGQVCQVVVLKGNHDYIDPLTPFFGFVELLPGVVFATEPVALDCRMADREVPVLFLPSTANPEEDWAHLTFLSDYDYIFCHQTFSGAVRDNGTKSEEGASVSLFDGFTGKVYSGDIHVPQRVGLVEYIGSPYRIDFGDSYTPRVIHIDAAGRTHNLHFPCPQKHLVEVSAENDVVHTMDGRVPNRGDQIKVRVTLKRADVVRWPEVRKNIQAHAEEHGYELFGPELRIAPEASVKAPGNAPQRRGWAEIVKDYAAQAGADAELTAVGVEIAKSA